MEEVKKNHSIILSAPNPEGSKSCLSVRVPVSLTVGHTGLGPLRELVKHWNPAGRTSEAWVWFLQLPRLGAQLGHHCWVIPRCPQREPAASPAERLCRALGPVSDWTRILIVSTMGQEGGFCVQMDIE